MTLGNTAHTLASANIVTTQSASHAPHRKAETIVTGLESTHAPNIKIIKNAQQICAPNCSGKTCASE